MFDFGINEEGDLIFDTDTLDIHSSTDDELRTQNAMCRIKSIQHDWYIDHIGADLEAILGQPNTSVSRSAGIEKITNSLTFDGLYKNEEIYIEQNVKTSTTVQYQVYLRTFDGKSASIIIVDLDLVKGVNVVIGG
jgi:hypothetical protein